jgi:4-diphosphocytidyl-2-C-methyl-D-erythritol kinase
MIRDVSWRDCLAPAKLNLMLHVTGRRDDGYHELETVFQLVDLCDRLHFETLSESLISLEVAPGATPLAWPASDDLAVRAAQLLRTQALSQGQSPGGVRIRIEKRIPVGGGLGGGSSDAATTLLALNRLWRLDWSLERLAQLGLALGADVPVFVRGNNAYARGVGEQLTPIALPKRHFVIVQPPVGVPTASVFREPNLTRDTKPLTLAGFAQAQASDAQRLPGHNDLEPVVVLRFGAVAKALSALQDAATRCGVDRSAVRMSGSGGCVFAATHSLSVAEELASMVEIAGVGRVHRCAALDQHPMVGAVVS